MMGRNLDFNYSERLEISNTPSLGFMNQEAEKSRDRYQLFF